MNPNHAGGPRSQSRVDAARLIVAAGLLLATPAALAQTEPSRGEIAAGAMFGAVVESDCDDLDGVMLADCSPRPKEWWISPAYHLTERVALVGEVSGRFINLKTSVTPTDPPLPLPPDLPPIALDLSTSTYAFGGGVRVRGRRDHA